MIINTVAEHMLKKGLEKRDLTRITKIDRHLIDKIYKKQVVSIKFETLNKLCFALDCTPNDLFKYIPDENLTKSEK